MIRPVAAEQVPGNSRGSGSIRIAIDLSEPRQWIQSRDNCGQGPKEHEECTGGYQKARAAFSGTGGLLAPNKRVKLHTGPSPCPRPEELLDISQMIIEGHWLVEVGRTVSNTAERMQRVRMVRMQDAQAVAEVDHVGQIPHYACATVALGIDQSTVHGTFEQELRYGRQS